MQVTVRSEKRKHVKLQQSHAAATEFTLFPLFLKRDQKFLGNLKFLLCTTPSIVNPLDDTSNREEFSAQLTPPKALSQWLTTISSLETLEIIYCT